MYRIYIFFLACRLYRRPCLLAYFYISLLLAVGGSVANAQNQGDQNQDITVNFPDEMQVSGSVDINYNASDLNVNDPNYGVVSKNSDYNIISNKSQFDGSNFASTYLNWNTKKSFPSISINFSSFFQYYNGTTSGSESQLSSLNLTINPSVALPSFNSSALKSDISNIIFGTDTVTRQALTFGMSAGSGRATDYTYSVDLPWLGTSWTGFKIPWRSMQNTYFHDFFVWLPYFLTFVYRSTLLYGIIYTIVYYP